MSIVGPRPLLPEDQPTNPSVRLSVRPGITGWAQVNGGKLLDPESKNALDEWYIRNASFWLDIKILWRTLLVMLRGEKLNEQAPAPTTHPEPIKEGYSAEAIAEKL
jgi:lipopolysaccharide/colanic/teichoic acid biosynthesis glycosyltransferase